MRNKEIAFGFVLVAGALVGSILTMVFVNGGF